MGNKDEGMPEDIEEAQEYDFKLTITEQEMAQLKKLAQLLIQRYEKPISEKQALEGTISWIIEEYCGPLGPYEETIQFLQSEGPLQGS